MTRYMRSSCANQGLELAPDSLITHRLLPRALLQVIKKVREHHKKKRREERKAAAAGKKPKAPKDPGIPSQWPFKEELLKEMAWKRQQILLAEKAKKEERKRAREVRACSCFAE
jgi:nuclear GTP-binding protein